MKNSWIKKTIPHFIATLIFLLIAVIYCRPVLEGDVLNQSDITHWKGAVQQSVEFNKEHGRYPLWTNSLFSGMPAFQIAYNSNNKVPWFFHTVFSLGLPKPIQFFFLASVCFYFLCTVLGIRTVIGIMGSLAFAYATYNPVIISAGHDTKMLSIAYMPALLGSILLIYEKKYWVGTAFTALFASILITMNHPQIAYYLFIAIGVLTVFCTIRWLKNKEWGHLIKAISFTLIAGVIGILVNAVSILSTYEYQKETIRGGGSKLAETSNKENAKTGLDKDYAFSYSMNITEPFVLMVPRIYGGSSDKEEVSQEKSEAINALRSLPAQLQQQLPLSYYWGGMTKPGEVGVSGPPYIGAIICFLAILGFFIVDNKHKWWMLAAIGLTIIMSWGGYFDAFNSLLYKYLPLYNKFRAPSMIMVVPQLLLPLLAALSLNKISTISDRKSLMPAFKKGLIATGVVFVILLMLYVTFDFLSGSDKEILRQVRDSGNAQLAQAVDSFYDGLKADRKSLMSGDIFRSLGFIGIAVLLVFLTLKNTIRPLTMGIGIALFAFIDVMAINTTYLSADDYKDKTQNEAIFQNSPADNEILSDTSYYRVFNFSGNAFSENITSYNYNSVGGYHAAKLSIYQDLISRQLSKQQPNTAVLNMLNTKYFIQKDRNGQTQAYQKNDSTLGHCWFVKGIRYVKDPKEEMEALDYFNPKDTAIIQETFKTSIPFTLQYDSAASIQLVKNDNDIVIYNSVSGTDQFAVFSEIYYPRGWKAYIDGKEIPIVKVNYVLRGLAVPAGKHEIKFEFKPSGYYKGRKLTFVFSIVVLVMLALGVFIEFRKNNLVKRA